MVQTGRPIAGIDVGILILETGHKLVVGNVQNALSFGFPVAYEVVRGVKIADLMRGAPECLPPILEAAERLQRLGVKAIFGACGSFVHFQREVAAKVEVPVFLSVMLYVPLILRCLPADQKLAIVFSRAKAFTPMVKDQCGIDSDERLHIVEASQLDSFRPICDQLGELDDDYLRREMTELARRETASQPNIGGWLLQCSELPPYSMALKQVTGRPVFDMTWAIKHLAASVSGAG